MTATSAASFRTPQNQPSIPRDVIRGMVIKHLIPNPAEVVYSLSSRALQDLPYSMAVAAARSTLHMFIEPQGGFNPAADGVTVAA